jgi:hypothetical protein
VRHWRPQCDSRFSRVANVVRRVVGPVLQAACGATSRQSFPTRVSLPLVTTLDGTKVWGKVFRYTLHHVTADQQQLVLTGPGLATQVAGEKRKEETYWEYVIVNGAQIASVKVARSG